MTANTGKLPDQAIKEFQVAWSSAFGEELTFEQAEAKALHLLTIHSMSINQK